MFHGGRSRSDSKRVRWIVCTVVAWSAVSAGQSAGTVSVWELRHPVPEKAKDFFRRTFVGDRGPERDAQAMREVLGDPQVAPYALKWMGSKHLDTGQIEAALQELGSAVSMLRGDSEAHALYGYALYTNGRFEEAEAETGRAMALDRKQPVANVTMALLLLGKFARGEVDRPDEELLGYIRKSQQRFPATRLLLASYYQHTDRPAEAAREASAFRRSGVFGDKQSRELIERWLGLHRLPAEFGGD